MPPKNPIEDFIMKVKTPTGEWVEAKALQSVEFAPGSADCGYRPYSFYGDDAVEFCGTFEPIPALRKRLSRKRIRKVLMSIGIPRNKADFQSRDMVQTLDMDSRKIEILAITLPGLMFWRKA